MAVWRLTGLVAAVALAAVVGTGTPAAYAAYGLYDHYEVCQSDGDFASLTNVSVRENVYVGAHDDLVRVLTQGGTLIRRIEGTGRPGESFSDPIVGTSAVGDLYVIDNPLFNPRLFKFSGGVFEREFTPDPYNPDTRLRVPVGLIVTRPGGRGSATGEVFVADVAASGVPAIKVWNADGTLSEIYAGETGRGRMVGISAVRGAVALAKTSDAPGVPSQVALFSAASKPLQYAASFNVVDFADGIAGAPDNTWWVLGGSYPGFAGLEHYGLGGNLLERVPIPGGGSALAVAPDGAVWVVRSDGLLRIGQNGGPIPPNQFGYGKCGPPRVQPSVPASQQIVRTRKLVVAASCSEACTLRASGTLAVPGGAARTFKLRPVARRVTAGRGARLALGLSRGAAGALRRAEARGRASTATVTLVAADAGQTKSARRLRLTIS